MFLTVSNCRKNIRKSKKVKLNHFSKLCVDQSHINSFIQRHQKRHRAELRKHTYNTRSSRVLPTSSFEVVALLCETKTVSRSSLLLLEGDYSPTLRGPSWRNTPTTSPQPRLQAVPAGKSYTSALKVHVAVGITTRYTHNLCAAAAAPHSHRGVMDGLGRELYRHLEILTL